MSKRKSRQMMRFGLSGRQRLRRRLAVISAACLFLGFIVFCLFFIYSNFGISKKAYAALSYTWTGSTSTDWNTNSNWSPVGIPSSGDDVTINIAAVNSPLVTSTTTINNLTINNGGSLTLSGFSLTVMGTATFNGGSNTNIGQDSLILAGTADFTGGTISGSGTGGGVFVNGISTTFGSAAGGPTIDACITVNSASLTIMNTIFNDTTILEKNAGGNDNSKGNNTFNALTTIKNSSTSGNMVLSKTTRDIFNADVIFTNSGSKVLNIANNDATGTLFNGNIFVNNLSSGSIRFGQNSGIAILSAGYKIIEGEDGFTSGSLYLQNFIQTDSSDQNITLTGTAVIYLQSGNIFNGRTEITSPGIRLDGSTYNDSAIFNKTGTTNDAGAGGNTFNNTLVLNNSGTGYLQLNGAGDDVYNGDIIMNNYGGGYRFGQNAGTCILADGKTINVGTDGFTSGILYLGNFTQTGNTAQELTLTGSAALHLQSGTTFNGSVNFTSPTIRLDGSTYNDTSIFVKTGSTNDAGIGGNTFNGFLILNNSGTGYLQLNGAGDDIYNDNITLNNTGGGFRFGQNAGTCILADSKTISVGDTGFSSGALYLMNFTQTGTTPQSLSFSGTTSLYLQTGNTFNGDVNFNSPQLYLSGTIFNGDAVLEKSGATNDQGLGGNIFNKSTTITNSGSGYLMTSKVNYDIFNGDLTLTNSGTSLIHVAYNDATGTQFNGDIYVNSTSGTGIQFGANTGTSTLANTKKITTGISGFTSGTLLLRNFAQTGATSQSLLCGGTAGITFGPASSFDGDIIVTGADLLLNGCTFNGIADLTKNGNANNAGTGGNTFSKTLTITNTGAGYLQFNGASDDIYNDNIIINNSGGGFRFGQNAGTCSLADGKTISIGAGDFTGGSLYLKNFTQIGTTSQSLTLSGTAALYLQTGTTFNGDVNFISPQLYLNGATFNGIATLEKNGASNNAGTGGNIFNQVTTITNSGTGYLMTANTTHDIFNSDVTYSNTNTSLIYAAYNDASGTQFNGNIIVNSTAGTGIQFGAGTGTSTLASNKTISVGALGFSAGTLLLRHFTQTGATSQSLIFSGAAGITFGPFSSFDGMVTSESAALLLNGSTFNSDATFTKDGATNDQGAGNNNFNGTTQLINNGTGYLMLSQGTRNIYNGDVTFTNTNSNIIFPAYNDATGTQFFGNIILNNTGAGSIRFGQNTGKAVLANGKTVSIGALGFMDGMLYLRNFIQTGSTAQAMNISSGTAALYFQTGTIFNGDASFNFPQVYLNGSTFNGVTNIEKNGATNNTGTGADIFNGITTITNSGTGIFYLANSNGDDFNNNVTFIQTGTGTLFPAYNTNSTFGGDISTNGTTTAITFGSSAGTVTIDGNVLQNINGNAALAPVMRRLVMNNGINGLKLNVPLTISKALTLNTGNINTTSSNLLLITNGVASVNNASDVSYVNGPVRKTGNQAFTFPTGNNGYYRPVSISAPGAAADHFTAEYIGQDPGILYNYQSYDPTLDHVSRCEYWNLNRTNGASNVFVTLSWNTSSCGITSIADMRVARWDAITSKWKDSGNGGVSGNNSAGTVMTFSQSTTFGVFTLSSSTTANPLPIHLKSFEAKLTNGNTIIRWTTATEINNDHFTIERSADGMTFEIVGIQRGAGNSNEDISYTMEDLSPLLGTSFYRLRQTDYDGRFEVFDPVEIKNNGGNNDFTLLSVSPNPFENFIKLAFHSRDNVNLEITLLKMDGSIAYSAHIQTTQGEGDYTINDVSDLPQGIYILKIMQDNVIVDTRKIMKK